MKVSIVIDKALKLLGYISATGEVGESDRIKAKALICVNLVYEDLYRMTGNDEEFISVEGLDDEIKLPQKYESALLYGVAGFIAQSESDGDMQQLYMSLYNRKRLSLSKIEQRIDNIPNPWG